MIVKNKTYGLTRAGYKRVQVKGRGLVYEHQLVAERVLGKLLPPNAVVHHIDGNRLNNVPSNLVICQDHAYHRLLHTRQDAYRATGDPNKRKCKFCKKYDDIPNMRKHGECYEHRICEARAHRMYRAKLGSQ